VVFRGQLILAAFVAAVTLTVSAAAPASLAPNRSWAKVASELSIPVYRPAHTFGHPLGFVLRIPFDPGCVHDGREMLRAFYGASSTSFFELLEGRPRYCIDTPIDAPIRKRVLIHGKRAPLYVLADQGVLILEWCERGTTITLKGTSIREKRLVAIARSMEPVDRAPAQPCVQPA
jgi:hypothetical protein